MGRWKLRVSERVAQDPKFSDFPDLVEDFRLMGKGRIQDQGVRQLPQAGNKDPDQVGIKLRIAAAVEFLEGFFRCARLLVRPLGSNCVVGVGNRDDSRAQWNLLAGK